MNQLFVFLLGVQLVPVRQRADASQCLLQEVRGQEVAQHGQPELHTEINQALEWRLVHAGDHPEGTTMSFTENMLAVSRKPSDSGERGSK